MGKYYITTTLPYVNSDPHLGFAMEIIRADVLARVHKLLGDDVFFNTGTDEHGQKIYTKAAEEGKETQKYVDEYAERFKGLKEVLNLSYDKFIRTTDKEHIEAAQEFWKLCEAKGDIYKKNYKVKYCVGCELEKTDSELEEGKCPIHPNLELQTIEEENYFFKFSNYQDKLSDLYKKNTEFVVPKWRQEEILKFVESGLQDFSISRLKAKMPWGIDVPGDEKQVMYVWFDALVNYVSTLGWPGDANKFSEFWPGVQVCGKDNLRQQSAMWQAMLMSAGLPNSRQIYVEGFITSDGQKMSKSLGNVIDPIEYSTRYGVDALRYYLLAKVSPFEDGDFTKEKFEEVYTSDLANGLGNLVARVEAMVEKNGDKYAPQEKTISTGVVKALNSYEFDKGLGLIWDQIRAGDTLINEREVWKQEGQDKKESLDTLVETIRQIAVDLEPFLPKTAEEIKNRFNQESIVKDVGLFPRLT